jgi:CRISPR/Cas system-associated exonuclease Cas4 (RecB family)
MQLTKTDFMHYLRCPKSVWLRKNSPSEYPTGEFSAFLQKLVREGYEVERYVQRLLKVDEGRQVHFQKTFESSDGLFARADAVEQAAGDKIILYEIKSSTSVKDDPSHNHIKDACFQKICAERAGQKVDSVVLVHLNGNYVRHGEIDPEHLLIFADISEKVKEIEIATSAEIDQAITFLKSAVLDKNGCSCLYNSRANHCDTFSLFNLSIPNLSIYSLPRLSQNRRDELITKRIFDLLEIPENIALTPTQARVVKSAKTGAPLVDLNIIRSMLASFQFPLHFLDYETFSSSVPLLDRTSPHKQFPVQYSLHILHENGALEHREYLEQKARLPDSLLANLCSQIGHIGSIVSWHASFEKTQNIEMAELFPEHAQFLETVNSRTVDLEDVFKSAYVDAQFDGSTSIKNILPVLCPKLSYSSLHIQDGTSAMEAWEKLIRTEGDEAAKISDALLRYCELDTFAMVEIYRFLADLCRENTV